MKKFLLILISLMLILSLISCDADTGSGDVPSDLSGSESSSESSLPPESEPFIDNGASEIEGAEGYFYKDIYVYGNWLFEPYGGNHTLAKDYAATISDYADSLGGKAKVYDLLVPISIEINLPKSIEKVTNPQRPFMDDVFDNLSSSVKKVDIYENLARNRDKGLYFRTDHHWNALGAFCAYEEFAKVAGFEPLSLSDYDEINMGEFLGYLHYLTKLPAIEADPDILYAYDPPGSYTCYTYDENGNNEQSAELLYTNITARSGKYSVFLGGDQPYMKIINDDPERDKKILVIKESFGNAFVPFIAPHYSEIHVADCRTFPYNIKDFVLENDIDEVLFVNNMFTPCNKTRINQIKDLINK